MKKDLTELVFILDRSGSMAGLEKDTVGGFNAMIEKQKGEEGTALVSTVLFSNTIENNIKYADLDAPDEAMVRAAEMSHIRHYIEKLPKIRKFMDYYLPTTLKLLNAYDRMSATGVSGENIDGTLTKVEGMMRNIVAAFEKQLDSLFGADALDISTDITVLETMMAREGLTDQPLKAQTSGGDDDYDIKLEL